jgi:BASS family bile acid:Na+ symporter
MLFARITALFPLWLLMAVGLSLWKPELFTWFSGNLISIGLGVIMLCMGLTLRMEDFLSVVKMPGWVLSGLVLQYTVMPLSGWAIAKLVGLPDFLALGLILVSCCPGGTASNVITFLAKGNVALSVSMTAISTLMAIIMTPLLTAALAGSEIDVPAAGLFLSTLKVVLLPIFAGLLMNRFFPAITRKIVVVSPALAVIIITLIVASIMGGGKANLISAGLPLLGAVVLLHSVGFGLGWIFATILFRRSDVSRTISIEVGMQNSGLGVVLARENVSHPAAAIPAALSSLIHSLIGSFLSFIWSRNPSSQSRG